MNANTKHKSKRTISMLLSLCMLLSLLPATAWAAENTGITITGENLNLGDPKDYEQTGGDEDKVTTILTNKPMTISGTSTADQIVIAEGVTANLTFDGLSIKRITDSARGPAVVVKKDAVLNLTLTGDNQLWSPLNGSESIAIRLNDTDSTGSGTLNITAKSTGTLTAIGYVYGIGGYGTYSGGAAHGPEINIAGGTVNAYGVERMGAGIGGRAKLNLAVTGGTVNAFGGRYGIYANVDSDGANQNKPYGEYDIAITGGTVTARGDCTFAADTYVPSFEAKNGGSGIYAASPLLSGGRSLHIGGDAVVEAVADTNGISLNDWDIETEVKPEDVKDSLSPISILVDGTAKLVAYGHNNFGTRGYGLGGELAQFGQGRTITITGDAEVSLAREFKKNDNDSLENHSYLGGGDNSGSTIILSGNARLRSAAGIGSHSVKGESAGDGGTIKILDNASVGFMGVEYEVTKLMGGVETNADKNIPGTIGGANRSLNTESQIKAAGSGGNITISTTGKVRAANIGGGRASGANCDAAGGSGGNITITGGTIYTNHIGGGSAYGPDTEGITTKGGDGGIINISGGVFRDYNSTSNINSPMGGLITHEYSSAGIGGGGAYAFGSDEPKGTVRGGNGGTINISGGDLLGNVAFYAIDNQQQDFENTQGAAFIGGGGASNCGKTAPGGNGGTINISGGNIRIYSISTNIYNAQNLVKAKYLPAFIGGGSAGGAGNITISGGVVQVTYSARNNAAYGADSSNLGAGKGATDSSGWVKVTGGSLNATQEKTDTRPGTWPTAADGNTTVYPVGLNLGSAQGLPEELKGNHFYNGTLVSMTVKDKATGQTVPYSTTNINIVNSSVQAWLPIPGGHTSLGNQSKALYDVTLKFRVDNTTYSFTGTISARKPSDSATQTSYYKDDVNINSMFTYGGAVTETLQLTSNWGQGNKIYNGADQKPTFTVKNSNEAVLTEGQDYTLKIEGKANAIGSEWKETAVIKNSGGYRVTATGVAGTAYEGMTAKIGFENNDSLWINPKDITATYEGGKTFTKQYDGTGAVYAGDDQETAITALPVTINSSDVYEGDTLEDIVFGPNYERSSIGTGIAIKGNVTYTYKQNGAESDIWNYSVLAPAGLKGDITVKVIGETNLDASGVSVSKVYDGSNDCVLKTNVSGAVTLKDLVGTEVATVSITEVSAFDDKNVGDDKVVTLTIGNLEGANSENYTLAGGATTVQVTNAKILPADYRYALTQAQQAQEFTKGGALSQILLPETAAGVNNEQVTGTVTLWHDAACTATPATNESVAQLELGEHSLYVKFTPAAGETNYSDKVSTGEVVVLTVVAGDPQELEWNAEGEVKTTYGTETEGKTVTNNSEGGGAITYASSNTQVATVDAETGALTIVGAGTATVTAKAAAVEGIYRETSAEYLLTVDRKAVSVTAEEKTKVFGTENPDLTFTYDEEDLVGTDALADLGTITLMTTALKNSPVTDNGYPITGTATGSANYVVTVTPGVLKVTKAPAPEAITATKFLLYSQAYTDIGFTVPGLPIDCGTKSFEIGQITDENSVLNGQPSITAEGIQFSTNSGNENDEVTIPITVTMQNYEDVVATITVKLVNKALVTISGVTVADKTYDGAAIAYTGTASGTYGEGDEKTAYEGQFEYIWSKGGTVLDSAPKDAGVYTLTVKISDDNEGYMGELPIPFTISQKAIITKPKNIAIYNGDALPQEFALEHSGIVGNDTIIAVGTPAFALQNDQGEALADSKTNGSYIIKWTNMDAVLLSNDNYIIEKKDGILSISNRPSDGGGGGTVTPPAGGTTEGSTVTTDATVSGDKATATVPESNITNAIKNAGENGNIKLEVKAPANATTVEVKIPAASADALANAKTSTTIQTPVATISFNSTAMGAIAGAGTGDVTITANIADTSKLPAAVKEAIGDKPVFEFTAKNGSKTVSSFNGGMATVSVPYTLKAGEDASNIVIWYVTPDGELHMVSKCIYDVSTGRVIFNTNHFSTYAVGHNSISFNDVSTNAWYSSAVQFVSARNLFGGVGDGNFAPGTTMTRGMFATVLARLDEADLSSYKTSAFTDVKMDSWYGAAIAWCADKGIVGGVGNGLYAPDQEITREQMALMLNNYIQYKNIKLAGTTKPAFADKANISAWALDAVEAMQQFGIISGVGDNTFNPNGTADRASVATIFMNFMRAYVK